MCTLDLDASVGSLSIQPADMPAIVEKEVTLRTGVDWKGDLSSVHIRELKLVSSALNLDAAGEYAVSGEEKKVDIKDKLVNKQEEKLNVLKEDLESKRRDSVTTKEENEAGLLIIREEIAKYNSLIKEKKKELAELNKKHKKAQQE